jgi:hypothetical protein
LTSSLAPCLSLLSSALLVRLSLGAPPKPRRPRRWPPCTKERRPLCPFRPPKGALHRVRSGGHPRGFRRGTIEHHRDFHGHPPSALPGHRRPVGARHQALRRRHGGRRPHHRHPPGPVLQPAGPVRLWEDHHAPHDRRVRGSHQRSGPPGRHRRDQSALLPPRREHRLPELRVVPAPQCVRQRGLRAPSEAPSEGRGRSPGPRGASAGRPPRLREPETVPTVGGPAAARGPGPGIGQPPEGAVARRTAGCP